MRFLVVSGGEVELSVWFYLPAGGYLAQCGLRAAL